MGAGMQTERRAQADAAVHADLGDCLCLTDHVLRGRIREQLLHDGADGGRAFERWKTIAFPELTATPEERDHE